MTHQFEFVFVYLIVAWCVGAYMGIRTGEPLHGLVLGFAWPVTLFLYALLAAAGLVMAPVIGALWLVRRLRGVRVSEEKC